MARSVGVTASLRLASAITAVGCLLLSSGWEKAKAETNPAETSVASALLDGMTFVGMMGSPGKELDVPDVYTFKDGTFQSKECLTTCQFPPQPYFVRQIADRIEFVSQSWSPVKEAEIAWQGSLEGETLKGTVTWTMQRWYWTIVKEFEFEANLKKEGTPIVSN